jgi:hypothetical protein
VGEAGNYGISGDLYENGTFNFVDRDDNTTYLTEGNQFIQLRFDGRRLRQNEYEGSYDLRVLTLCDYSSPVPPTPTPTATPPPPLNCNVSSIYNFWSRSATRRYHTNDIKHLLWLRGTVRVSQLRLHDLLLRIYRIQTLPAQFNDIYSDYGEDTDSDGLYNYLVINVGVNVSEAGYYTVDGELYENGTYNFVDCAYNTTHLNKGDQVVQLRFDAWAIMRSGTFDLKYLGLYNATYPPLTPPPPTSDTDNHCNSHCKP